MKFQIGEKQIPVLRWNEGNQELMVWTAGGLTPSEREALLGGGITVWEDSGQPMGITLPALKEITAVGYLCAVKTQAEEELALRAAELEQILSDARAGLIAAPVAGEDWDAAKWYRSAWRCIKAHEKSVIRQPSAVQGEYWEAVT